MKNQAMTRIDIRDHSIDYNLRWEYAGIPSWYRGISLDQMIRSLEGLTAEHSHARRVISWAQTFVDTFPARRRFDLANPKLIGVGAALVGTEGAGKTALACAVLMEIHKRYDASICYITADNLIKLGQLIKKNAEELTEWHRRHYTRAHQVSLLALDGFGEEEHSASNKELAWLISFLRRRYNAHRPTLVISQHPIHTWGEYSSSLPKFAETAFPQVSLAGWVLPYAS